MAALQIRPGQLLRKVLIRDASAKPAASSDTVAGPTTTVQPVDQVPQIPEPITPQPVAPQYVAPEPVVIEQPPAPPAIDYSQQINDLLLTIHETVTEHEHRRSQSLGELQDVAVELAIAVAEQVIAQSLDREAFNVEGLVARVIGRLRNNSKVTIALHPADLKLLRNQQTVAPQVEPAMGIDLIADATIARGCCRADSEARSVVSNWRTHLAEIRAGLQEELEHAQAERRSTEAANTPVKRYPDRRETA